MNALGLQKLGIDLVGLLRVILHLGMEIWCTINCRKVESALGAIILAQAHGVKYWTLRTRT